MEIIRSLTRIVLSISLISALVACSLVSLKSPEKPLSTRDLNTRILTREYSARFIAGVEQIADQIAAGTEDPLVRMNTLRWKIAASGKSQRAASQMAPMMALLDTWALSVQMCAYLQNGTGRMLFGSRQPLAIALCAQLARQIEDLAHRLTTRDEFEADQRFIDTYAHEHPIESLHFARASIVDLWTQESGAQVKLVDSLGTVPEAMADAGDLLRMYGDNGPSQVLWQAQLAAQESGISGKDFSTALKRLDDRMARFSEMADATPNLVDSIVRDARIRLNESWVDMMRDIHAQGLTLAGSVAAERQAAVSALDTERAAMAADTSRIASQVIREAGLEARRFIRDALLLVIALTIVLFGVPFAAGYFVGRVHGSSAVTRAKHK